MKNLLWLALLLPTIAFGQISGSIQRTAATGTVRYWHVTGPVVDTLANAFKNKKIAYVDTLGNNTTGSVGRQDKPFATIVAAIDALGASGIIQIGVGTFASPDSSKIKSNYWFKGSGKPVPNWTVTNPYTKTAPTKLINGTILQGKFDGSREKNITVSDLGIDVGSAWCTASNGGVASEGLYFWAYDYLNPHAPLPGIVVRNVSVLGQSATAAVHAALFENLYYPIVDNLSTYFAAAGIVIKTTGGTFNQLQGFGHNTHGLYIKGNDAIVCRDLVITNVELANIGAWDNGGIGILSGETQSVFNVLVSGFSIRKANRGIRVYANTGTVNDNIIIQNGTVDSISGDGIFIDTLSLNHSKFSNIIIRDAGDDGFEGLGLLNSTFTDISAYASTDWNFRMSSNAGTSASSYATNLLSGNTANGMYFAGNGMYATGLLNSGTTSGTPLTNLVAASVTTPFSVGATSVTSTGAQLNYLNAATGTTGTTSSNIVFSASPTITGTFSGAIANFTGQVALGVPGGTQENLKWNYTSNVNSRSWITGVDTNVNGDWRLAQSTTQTGTTWVNALYFDASRNATFSALSGTGDRMVQASSTGVLSASQIVTSGTYTPTITYDANTTANAVVDAHYMQIGNEVTVAGWISVNNTVTLVNSRIHISLPIASNFTAQANAGGVFTAFGAGAQQYSLNADATTDNIDLQWLQTGTGADRIQFSFTYTIL